VWDTGTYNNQSRDRDGHELSMAEAIGYGHVSVVLRGKKSSCAARSCAAVTR
jgi:hypothetical protein